MRQTNTETKRERDTDRERTRKLFYKDCSSERGRDKERGRGWHVDYSSPLLFSAGLSADNRDIMVRKLVRVVSHVKCKPDCTHCRSL